MARTYPIEPARLFDRPIHWIFLVFGQTSGPRITPVTYRLHRLMIISVHRPVFDDASVYVPNTCEQPPETFHKPPYEAPLSSLLVNLPNVRVLVYASTLRGPIVLPFTLHSANTGRVMMSIAIQASL